MESQVSSTKKNGQQKKKQKFGELSAEAIQEIMENAVPIKTKKTLRNHSFFYEGMRAGGIWVAPFKNRMNTPQLTNFFTCSPLIPQKN